MVPQSVYSLSISGRAILDMHSLNNEGGEGNQITTRMVTIVHKPDGKPTLATVNAISGDMFKHIQAEHLYRLGKGNLKLCAGCEKFSASRILDDKEFMNRLPDTSAEVIDALLKHCALDDLEGNLIAKANRSVPRKSVAEFGWVVGLPEVTRTESYFHVRYATEHGEDSDTQKQAIFHRPASSGVYAVGASFEMARIGYNDITQKYAIQDDERARRYTTFLESILYTFVEPNGAMRGTQNPHILGFEGVVTVSNQVVPAPMLSALDDGYREEVKRVAAALNAIHADAVTVHEFDSMGAFAEVMQKLIAESVPFKMNVA
ncbi:MAG: DevR family CRISPR-associated autoregulator [Candidatus Villigracilaceae bacterium]